MAPQTNSYWIVMEYFPQGDLYKLFHDRNWKPLPLNVIRQIMLHISQALIIMHANGIVHGDIKPENVLIASYNKTEASKIKVKLGDFGMSKVARGRNVAKQVARGTDGYVAPEILAQQSDNESQDIWSLGCLFFELLT